MNKITAIICVVLLLALAVPVHAYEERGEDVGEEETIYEETVREPDYVPKKKSVATATLLSVVPGFGAGLYYAGEYTFAISSTITQATGLGLILDSVFRTHNDGELVSGITAMGASWLIGIIYAPLSVHEYNKALEEEYALRPYVNFSHKSLYAGVAFSF